MSNYPRPDTHPHSHRLAGAHRFSRSLAQPYPVPAL